MTRATKFAVVLLGLPKNSQQFRPIASTSWTGQQFSTSLGRNTPLEKRGGNGLAVTCLVPPKSRSASEYPLSPFLRSSVGPNRYRHSHQQRFFFNRKKPQDDQPALTADEEEDFENLIYIAQKRNVQVTVRKGSQAGVAAGVCIMLGTVLGGPIGTAAGGLVGTLLAVKISKKVVSLNQMLKDTPRGQRREVYKLFSEAIKEEFEDNAELKLLTGKGTFLSAMRYCLDRDLMEKDKLEKLDSIFDKVRGKTKALEG